MERGARHVAVGVWPAHIPAAHQLSREQLAFFDTFGYLHLPALLGAETGAVIDAFEEVWTRRGDTVAALMHGQPRRPHTGGQRSFLVPFCDQSARTRTGISLCLSQDIYVGHNYTATL